LIQCTQEKFVKTKKESRTDTIKPNTVVDHPKISSQTDFCNPTNAGQKICQQEPEGS
jgi:hypothetical protein